MRNAGVTLVEVLVALLLLTVGAIALAGGIAHAERARDRALKSALALGAAESWLEAWRARSWNGVPDSGSQGVSWGARTGRLTWTADPLKPCLVEARVSVAPDGPGPGPVVLVSRRFREGVAGC